jgi:hypothetical protein
MKIALRLAFILFVLFFIGSGSLEYQKIEAQDYNMFVQVILYLCAFILKGILTALTLVPVFFSIFAFILAIILDIVLSVFSLELIFPLTKLVWNLDVLLVNTIVDIWSEIPPVIYVKPNI